MEVQVDVTYPARGSASPAGPANPAGRASVA